MSITASRILGAQRSLCLQITKEIRNGNHAGCLLKEGNACFPLRSWGMDIVKDMVTFAFCRARPLKNSPECLSQTLLTRPLS